MLREHVCICISHHLHGGASYGRLQQELEVWDAVDGSRGVGIDEMFRGDDMRTRTCERLHIVLKTLTSTSITFNTSDKTLDTI